MHSARFVIASLLLLPLCLATAQQPKAPKKKEKAATSDSVPKAPPIPTERFFQSEKPVDVTLTVNMKQLSRDKGDNAPWRNATMTVPRAEGDTGGPVTIPLKVKTRGIWRLKTCEFPPIRLNFASADVKSTALRGLDKVKLVSYCRNNDDYEQYVLQEQQLYRAYTLLTPATHRTRLLHVTYADSVSGKPFATRYGFVIEDVDDLAARLGGKRTPIKGAMPDDLDPAASAMFGVFQYFAGNTDFAIGALHNVELVQSVTRPDVVIPIAYDFDFSGAVNARYATPDPSLKIRRVRDRLFRGYCTTPAAFNATFDVFRQKKDAIYALYHDDIGKLLKPDVVKSTLEYFDDFYKTIGNAGDAKHDIIDSCMGKR